MYKIKKIGYLFVFLLLILASIGTAINSNYNYKIKKKLVEYRNEFKNYELSDDYIKYLQNQAIINEWTYDMEKNSATNHLLSDLCGFNISQKKQNETQNIFFSNRDILPDRFDWRDINGVDYTTPIRSQGMCGSCWAFATVAPLESNIKFKDGIDIDLSEQWLVSCNTYGWNCDEGGWWAHEYHKSEPDQCGDSGAVLEQYFPYVGYDASCNCPYIHDYFISDWGSIDGYGNVASVESIKQAIMSYGPVSAAVCVNSAFHAYNGGIFNGPNCSDINHGVTIIGWNDNQGTDGVWIIKNSWGQYWGENGYMRIEYNVSSIGYDACYIVYPYVMRLESVTNMDTNKVFTSIQSAIDDIDTDNGDTIVVRPRVYYENIIIYKSVNIKGVKIDGLEPIIDSSGVNCGITLNENNSLIEGLTITNSSNGIKIESNSNTIKGNKIINNQQGIFLNNSNSNLIYNNYFNNTINAYDTGINHWNITKTIGTNIINGSHIGGNFWSDYSGYDTNGDGLGDTMIPHNSSRNILYGGDFLPLTESFNTCPFISNESPSDGETDVDRPPYDLNISVEDEQGDTIDVYLRWKNNSYYSTGWITLNSYLGIVGGDYSYSPNSNEWIWGNTTYIWSVNVTDVNCWTNETYTYITSGSRYDVSNNDVVDFQDAGLCWIYREAVAAYDGLYDVNQNGVVNFQDAGLCWINRD